MCCNNTLESRWIASVMPRISAEASWKISWRDCCFFSNSGPASGATWKRGGNVFSTTHSLTLRYKEQRFKSASRRGGGRWRLPKAKKKKKKRKQNKMMRGTAENLWERRKKFKRSGWGNKIAAYGDRAAILRAFFVAASVGKCLSVFFSTEIFHLHSMYASGSSRVDSRSLSEATRKRSEGARGLATKKRWTIFVFYGPSRSLVDRLVHSTAVGRFIFSFSFSSSSSSFSLLLLLFVAALLLSNFRQSSFTVFLLCAADLVFLSNSFPSVVITLSYCYKVFIRH